MTVIGTINKRVDVGFDRLQNNRIYIMASTNCIMFDEKELNSLMAVLSILSATRIDYAVDWLKKHPIDLFEPAPPPAEEKR